MFSIYSLLHNKYEMFSSVLVRTWIVEDSTDPRVVRQSSRRWLLHRYQADSRIAGICRSHQDTLVSRSCIRLLSAPRWARLLCEIHLRARTTACAPQTCEVLLSSLASNIFMVRSWWRHWTQSNSVWPRALYSVGYCRFLFAIMFTSDKQVMFFCVGLFVGLLLSKILRKSRMNSRDFFCK